MEMNKTITISVGLFVFFTLLVLAVPKPAYSGVPFSLGCCVTEGTNPDCLGCGVLENCAIPQQTCLVDLEGGFFEGGSYCVDGEGAEPARCVTGGSIEGCCVNSPGSCEEGVVVSACGGDLWVPGDQCSEVPQCVVASNVPALSQWGIIAVAVIIGIVGFIVIRRRKATI